MFSSLFRIFQFNVVPFVYYCFVSIAFGVRSTKASLTMDISKIKTYVFFQEFNGFRSYMQVFFCLFVFNFFGSTTCHVGSQFTDQGSNISPLKWKHGVLTTGLPGKIPTLKSLTSFELILAYGIRELSRFIILHATVQFFQHHLLKRLLFFHCMSFAYLS